MRYRIRITCHGAKKGCAVLQIDSVDEKGDVTSHDGQVTLWDGFSFFIEGPPEQRNIISPRDMIAEDL